MPTALLPGIGASIRISFAASAILISYCKLLILLTRTPRSGFTSNLVTDGPMCVAIKVARTPNSSKISINRCPLSFAALIFAVLRAFFPISFNKVSLGNLYFDQSSLKLLTNVSLFPIVSSMIRLSSFCCCTAFEAAPKPMTTSSSSS